MYQTLYRVHRPMTFDEVIGQDHIIKTLKNQVKNNTLSHAYLFTGDRGTGKTSTAKILSRAVNCKKPIEGNPCNECEVCKHILNEETMDILEMDAASNRSIQDIRGLKEMIAYPPTHGKYKSYIVDEVHMLTNEAFNALLKTLEEPPEFLIFILATTEPEKLPDTILSRCQRFDFKRVSERDLADNINSILNKNDREIEEAALNMIVREASGSVRDSLSILERFLGYSDKKITKEDALFLFGSLSDEALLKIARSVLVSDADDLIKGIDNAERDGKDFLILYRDLMRVFRDILIVLVLGYDAKNVFYMGESEFKNLFEVAKYSSKSKIERILMQMIEKEGIIKKSELPKVLIETLLISFMEIEEKEINYDFKRELTPSKDKEGIGEQNDHIDGYDYEPIYEGEEAFVDISYDYEEPIEEERKENKPQIPEQNIIDETPIEKDEKEEKVEENIEGEIELDIKNISEKEVISVWRKLVNDLKGPSKQVLSHMRILGVEKNVLLLDKSGFKQTLLDIALSKERIKEFEGTLSSSIGEKIAIRFKEKSDDEEAIKNYFDKNILKII